MTANVTDNDRRRARLNRRLRVRYRVRMIGSAVENELDGCKSDMCRHLGRDEAMQSAIDRSGNFEIVVDIRKNDVRTGRKKVAEPSNGLSNALVAKG